MNEKDEMLWFDRLFAPKHLNITKNKVFCSIGFNRQITENGVIRVKGVTIEVEAGSIAEAIQDARLQYEFLTADVLGVI